MINDDKGFSSRDPYGAKCCIFWSICITLKNQPTHLRLRLTWFVFGCLAHNPGCRCDEVIVGSVTGWYRYLGRFPQGTGSATRRPDGGLGGLKDVALGWIQKKKVSSFTKWDIASNDIKWYQLILNDIDYLDSIYNDIDNLSYIKWY